MSVLRFSCARFISGFQNVKKFSGILGCDGGPTDANSMGVLNGDTWSTCVRCASIAERNTLLSRIGPHVLGFSAKGGSIPNLDSLTYL